MVYCSGTELSCAGILDCLEQRRKYFAHRVYNEHVLLENASYAIKNYDFLLSGGRNADNTIVVENTVAAYCLNLFNGVPVQRFDAHTSPTNPELVCLARYLEELNKKSSVCKHIEGEMRTCMILK